MPRLVLWTLAAGAVTFGTLSLIAPRFESEAQIAVAAKGSSKVSDPKREGQGPEAVAVRMDKEAVNTHVRALLSRDLAAKAIETLKLNEQVEFNSALGAPDALSGLLRLAGIGAPRSGETQADRVMGAYFKRLEVYPAKESRVIGVRFSSSDPRLAADVANLIVEDYRQSLASRSVAETDEVQKALEPKITVLKQELSDAEQAVEKLRGQANIFKGGQQATGLNEQQLAELTAELSKAKSARSEAEARTKSAREMMKAGSADALPDVQKSPLIQNLVQQRVRAERQISELSASLLPGHPRMLQLAADLAGLNKQIKGEVAKVVDSLDKEAKVAALREDSIEKSLSEIKARIVTASPDEVKLRQLENDAKSKRSELERLQAQYESNRTSDDSRTVGVEVQVITQAGVSSVPVFPKKAPLSALVMVATFLFGLVAIVTRGLLSGARRPAAAPVALTPADTEAEAETALAVQEAAARPKAAASQKPPAAAKPAVAAVPGGLPVAPQAAAPSPTPARPATAGAAPSLAVRATAAEPAIEKGRLADIAQRILSRANGTAGFRTLVAGDTAEFEPPAEALALATSLSASGRSVVLVDWSTRGAGFAAVFGVAGRPGISELLDGRAKFDGIVHAIPGSGVHVIGAGHGLERPGEGADADRINLVLDALDEAYDHIVVTARHDEARALFELIEGRFDAGVSVSDARGRGAFGDGEPDMFLGFEVSDIDIIRFERPGRAPAAAAPSALAGGAPGNDLPGPPPLSAAATQRLQRLAGQGGRAGNPAG